MNYFSNEATTIANLWITEFHLSSYKLLEDAQDQKMTGLVFLGGDRLITRAGAGFRFVGDFFDRYWTCHVLESAEDDHSQILADFNELVEPKELLLHGPSHHGERYKKPWRQRKVLELLLFSRMLKKITGRYKKMIAETSGRLNSLFPKAAIRNDQQENIVLVSNALFSAPIDNNAYLTFSKNWPPFNYTLQVMEEDLNEILDKIGLWRDREAARHPEEPRWTKNDESRYRAAITKLTTSNNHEIRQLSDYRATIQSLRTSLTSGLESTRNELSFRSAENVRFFTYITVIFLPLGFATAIFSMSDSSPKRETLNGMVVTAFITLLLTVFMLVSVQKLNRQKLDTALRLFRTPEASTAGNGSSPSSHGPGYSLTSSGAGSPPFASEHKLNTASGGEHVSSRISRNWGLWRRDSRRRRETREARKPDDPKLEEGKPN